MDGWDIAMPQFMIEKKFNLNEPVVISGSDAHHIIDVLRLGPDDWIVLSDGKGNSYKGDIKRIDKKAVSVLISKKLPSAKTTGLTLAQAVIKHDRIETIIQKAVELGVVEIRPFTSIRTIPRFSKDGLKKKVDRWNKIAIEASKQCGLSVKPVVKPIATLEDVFSAAKGYNHKLMFYEGETENSLQTYFQPPPDLSTQALTHLRTIILIGPEGGFAPEEVALAKKHGFTTLRLGPLIMRVETAAISAITLTQYLLGHFDI